MKLKGKALLSLLLVMTLVAQLLTVSAFATNGEGLGSAVYLFVDGQTVPLSAENEYLLNGGVCSITVANRVLDGSFAVETLMTGDLCITPPAGWYVKRAWLSGDGSIGAVSLPLDAQAGGTAVTMRGDAFIRSNTTGTPVFEDGLLSSYGGYYTLGVLLAQLPASETISVTDNYGTPLGASFYAPAAAYADGYIFRGWRLQYEGSSVIVQPNEYVTAYANATLSPVFAAQVTLRPADMSAAAGASRDAVLAGATVQLINQPAGVNVIGAYVSSNAPDILVGGTVYELYVNPGFRLVDNNMKDVDPNVAFGVTAVGYLTVEAPAHTHTPGAPVQENVLPATCYADGVYDEVVYCAECGEELSRETRVNPTPGHVAGEAVQENVIPATCTADGSYELVVRCSVCGTELSRTTQTVPTSGHIPAEAVRENVIPATCTTEGSYEEVIRCSVCGTELSHSLVTVPASGHNWGAWVETVPATEAAEGEETRTCLNDPSHIETQPIARLAHTHTPVKSERVPASCEVPGTEEYWTCSGCGLMFSDEGCTQQIEAPAAIPASGHNWGEWVETTPATEAAEGEETRTCLNDPTHIETQPIARLTHTHTPVKSERAPASCEVPGTEEYWTCSGCGLMFSDEGCTQQIEAPAAIPASGHNWGEWVETTPATEAAEGEETRTCLNDPTHIETQPIARLTHTHTPVKSERAPASCEVPGTEEYWTCSGCGLMFSDEGCTQQIEAPAAIPASGHTPGEPIHENETASSCSAEGGYDEIVKCSVCGATISSEHKTLEKLPHTPVKTERVPASCEVPGVEEYWTCSVCGLMFSDEACTEQIEAPAAIPASGHNWGAWTPVTPATETTEGSETRTCLNDASHTETRAIPVLSHTHSLSKTERVEPTYTAPGNIEYWSCSGCGKLFSDAEATQEIDQVNTVIPKLSANTVTVTVNDQELVYSGAPQAINTQSGVAYTVTGLADSDSLTVTLSLLDGSGKPVETVTAAGSYSIQATASGYDTNKYSVAIAKVGTLTVAKYPLTVTADPAVKVYDGTATVSSKATAALLPGHSFRSGDGVVTAVYDSNNVLQANGAVAVGTYTNKITAVHIVDANSNEVTDNYALTFVDGTITVSEAPVAVLPVTITIENQTWVNDGTAHTLDPTKYTAAGLPAGEDIHVTLQALDAAGNPLGASPTTGTYRIMAYHQADAKKYNVTVVPGILTVTAPVVYKLKTDDIQAATVVSPSWAKNSLTGLSFNIDAEISRYANRVDVDNAQLPASYYSVVAGSTVVTLSPSYLNTLTEGMHGIKVYFTDGSFNATFSVTAPAAAPITITGRNVSKSYDGQPYNMASYGANSYGINAVFHLVKDGAVVASAVEAGTYSIYLDQLSGSNSAGQAYKFTVKDAEGNILTSDYKNTPMRIGTLTITAATVTPLTITIKDQSWTYDGAAHALSVTDANRSSYYTVDGLQAGDSINVKLSIVDQSGRTLSSVTNVGSYNIKAEYSGLTPGKYNVTITNQGTLTVVPFKLTLTAVSATKNYDGSATFDKKSNVSATALVSGHKFRSGDGVKFSIYDQRGNLIQNGPIEVGTYSKKVTEVHIVDANNNEVTSNYDITRIDGTLTILPGNGSPRTGDTNNLILWIGLLAASALLIVAVAVTLLRRRKRAAGDDPKVNTRRAGK